MAAAAVAKKVLVGTTTSRPSTPRVRKMISRAPVPLLTAMACGTWWRRANASSNSRVRGPRVSEPARSDSSIMLEDLPRGPPAEKTILAAGIERWGNGRVTTREVRRSRLSTSSWLSSERTLVSHLATHPRARISARAIRHRVTPDHYGQVDEPPTGLRRATGGDRHPAPCLAPRGAAVRRHCPRRLGQLPRHPGRFGLPRPPPTGGRSISSRTIAPQDASHDVIGVVVSTGSLPDPRGGRVRRATATARFGSSRRESHDATGFYERFVAPELSDDTTVVRSKKKDVIYRHDARDMGVLESNSVALVVTSPPYFAGKEYERSLGQNGVPGTYFEYLDLLHDGVRRVQACPRARRAHRREHRQPGATALPVVGGRRDRDPPGSRSSPAGGGRVVEGSGGRWLVCLGNLPTAEQPGPARRDGAHRHRQQGPLRSGVEAGAAPRRWTAVDGDHLAGRVPGGHHGPVGDATRERHPCRSSRSVSGGAPETAHRALHLRERRRARSLHGIGHDGRRGTADAPALHRLRHRPLLRHPRQGARRRGARASRPRQKTWRRHRSGRTSPPYGPATRP